MFELASIKNIKFLIKNFMYYEEPFSVLVITQLPKEIQAFGNFIQHFLHEEGFPKESISMSATGGPSIHSWEIENVKTKSKIRCVYEPAMDLPYNHFRGQKADYVYVSMQYTFESINDLMISSFHTAIFYFFSTQLINEMFETTNKAMAAEEKKKFAERMKSKNYKEEFEWW